MNYKRILVAVDGSKTSALAFQEAITQAKAFKATLCIVHVIEKLPTHVAYAIDVAKYQDIALKAAQKTLEKYSKLAAKNKIPAKTRLIEIINYKDSISKKILQAVKKSKADLLVMGTHGRTGFSRFMLGSVAEETLKSCSVPMLLLRKP